MIRFRWLINPYLMGILALVGVFLGVVGLLAYLASRSTRDLSYYVRPTRTIITRTGQTSEIKVLYRGQEVASDVSGIQIAVWNRGRASIRREHILEPIVIQADPGVSILEAKVSNQTRSVVRFALDNSGISAGKVAMRWQILEQNDGAVVQIIYAGTPEANFAITGVVEGQHAIRDRSKARLRMPWFEYASMVALLLVAGYAMRLRTLRRKNLPTRKLDRYLLFFLFFWIPLNILALLDALTTTFGRRGPPFGF